MPISLVRPSAKWWWHITWFCLTRMIRNDVSMNRAKFKQITNEWKWYENDRMLRAKRLEKVTSIVSLVTIDKNLPVQITLSIYTFKYTHTTQGFTTQWRMRWWMLKWVNGYGRGDDDTIVMTLITMVRYFRIFARHDNPSLYAFFYMSILNDTSLYTVTLFFCAETILRTHLFLSILYYNDYIINEINAVQMILIYECNIVKDYVSRSRF